MPSSLEIIYNVNDPNQSGWLEDFLLLTPAIPADEVRGDVAISVTLRPVRANADPNTSGQFPWIDDHISTDDYRLGIGLPDEPATGGTFKLDVSGTTTNLTLLAYNIPAATLVTPLSAASVAEGYGALTVTNPASGVYVVTWTNTGSLVPPIVADATNLLPNSEIIVSVIKDGDETPTTHPQQIISIRQQLVALSEPDTELPSAGVTRTYAQTATASQNMIVRIAFDAEDTYGGLYSISAIAGGISAACGQIGPLATVDELGAVLQNHPAIFYRHPTNAPNVIVTQDGTSFLIEFTGTLAGSTLANTITDATVANPTELTTATAHGYRTGDSVTFTNSSGITPSLNGTQTITVTSPTKFTVPVNVTVAAAESATVFNNTETTLTVSNVNLLAPKGKSGILNLNTYNLASAFWQTTDDTLTFYLSIERTRASGEIRTSLLVPIQLKRDIIDVTSLVPLSGVGGLAIGNMIYVDAVFGSDSNSGNFGAPFQTLGAAKAAAGSGDTIYVYPGTYTVTASLAKTGVNWDFEVGAIVTNTTDDETGIWDDGGSAMTFTVAGNGDFTRTAATESPSVVMCSHASSNITVYGRDMTLTAGDNALDSCATVYQSAGTLKVKARNLVGGTGDLVAAVWWANGQMDVEVSGKISATNYSVYSAVNATPTGIAVVRANEISSPSYVAVSFAGSNTAAAMWVYAATITGGSTSGLASVYGEASNKGYVIASKLFGRILLTSGSIGQLYVTADKVAAIINGTAGAASLLQAEAGDAYIDVKHWDRDTFTGETFEITGGTVRILGGEFTGGTAKGLSQTGGTLVARNLYLNTSGNNATNPITKTGGTMRLNNCIIVAEATRDSIEASTAQNVVAMGCWANKAVDANVTITTGGGLTVDIDVT